MKKYILFLFFIWISIGISNTASAKIYYYSGTMDAAFTVEENIEISMPAGVTMFIYNCPLPQNYDYSVNSQNADSLQIIFSPQPNSSKTKTDEFGNQYAELVWNNPLSGTITGIVTYSVSTTADWDKFVTSDLFPVDNKLIPQDVAPFLEATSQVQSDDDMITLLAGDLTNGLDQQWKAVLAVCGWVMDNITYGQNSYIDAVSTYNDKVGVCSNFSHLACAVLRAVGIPARFVGGLTLSKPYSLPYESGSFTSIDWNQGLHAWIEIYYPSLGWVPYEPQRDLHHIDTHRISYGAGKDNNSLFGSSECYSYSLLDSYPSISSVPTITWATDNINLTYVKEGDEINDNDTAFSTPVTFISPETVELSLNAGWNLVSSGIGFNVTQKCSDKTKFTSVWKWKDGGWAVYLSGEEIQGVYAAAKGFEELSTISSGEGFWVNSIGSETISIEGISTMGSLTLTSGWNLVGLKSNETKLIVDLVSGNKENIASIWKWDDGKWGVYLPSQEDGGADYAESKGFTVLSNINPGEGFWVNCTGAVTFE